MANHGKIKGLLTGMCGSWEGAEQGCGWCRRLSIKNRLRLLQAPALEHVSATICVLISTPGRESLQTIPIKVPIHASSLLRVPSCDKTCGLSSPRKHKTLIALTAAFKERSRGLNQVAAQIICRRRAAPDSGTLSDG